MTTVLAACYEEVCWPPVEDETSRSGTPLGRYLETIRKRRRFSQQLLADRAGVSAAYVRQLERGFNQETGRPIEPSPRILYALATVLADDHPEEIPRLYLDLMQVAGYLPAEIPVAPSAAEAVAEERARIRSNLLATLAPVPEPLRTAMLDLYRQALGE